MPWEAGDAKGFTDKADTPEKQEAWARVANGALARCMERSDNQTECEASAIRQANDAVDRIGKSHSMCMAITKTERLSNGRVRWRARANSGDVDTLNERCDITLFEDFVQNFWKVQESATRGEALPDGMEVPQLDLSHYSFRLPPEKRSMARVGWPFTAWTSGKAFMVQGYFDDTPIGRLAAKALREGDGDVRVSIGFYPDWGNVGMEDGVLVYRGGRGNAYFDHLALTAHPVDPQAMIELDTEEAVAMSDKAMTLADDALAVLGDDGAEVVEQLEEARQAKSSVPDGAIIKNEGEEHEEEDVQDEPEVDAEEAEGDEEAGELGEALSAVIHEAIKAKTKSVGDHELVAGDFLVVGDAQDPNTWHLPVKVRGETSKELMDEAWKSTQDEGLKARLKALYEVEGMDVPEEKSEVDVAALLQGAIKEIGKAIGDRLAPIESSVETLQRQVDALAASDTEKVKAALDDEGGDWLQQSIMRSVQRPAKAIEEEAQPGGIMGAYFPRE